MLLHRSATMGIRSPSSTLRGRLRTVQVWIGDGSSEPRYYPPPAELVPARLVELLRWWRTAYSDVANASRGDVVQALARLCHGILAIHPFLDGNGRLAAALTDQAAHELLGLSLGEALSSDHAAYFAALREADNGNLSDLADFINAALA